MTVECHVPGSELLAAEESTILTSVKDEISHETSRSVVHENTKLLVVGATTHHFEANVLQAGGLGDLPVDTGSSSSRHGSDINDKVANLSVEVVLVCVPVTASIVSDLIRSALGIKTHAPPSSYGSESITAIPLNPEVALMVGRVTASPMN